MFSAIQKALQYMGQVLGHDLDDSDQDSTYGSTDSQSSGEQNSESDTESKHEGQENEEPIIAVGGFDRANNDAAPANYSQDKPKQEKNLPSPSEKQNFGTLDANDSQDVPSSDFDEATGMDLSLIKSPTPSEKEKRAAWVERFSTPVVNNNPKDVTSSQETNYEGRSPTASELEELEQRAIGQSKSEKSWFPGDDEYGLNPTSPTPSELERRAARFNNNPKDSDEGLTTRRVSPPQPQPPAVPHNYNYRPTREQELARAELVENTSSDELYFSHPNPLALRYPDWLAWPVNPNISDLEKKIQRDIRSFEYYYDLPAEKKLPEWFETLLRDLVEWPYKGGAANITKPDSPIRSLKSTKASSSTGTIPTELLGRLNPDRPGHFYWETPSDIMPILFRANIEGVPRVLKVTNPDPESPQDEKPGQKTQEQQKQTSSNKNNNNNPSSSQESKGSKRKASTPQEKVPHKRSRTTTATLPNITSFDGAADTPPNITSFDGAAHTPSPNPPRRNPERVVRPRPPVTPPAPAVQRQKRQGGSGFGWPDLIFLLVLIASLGYACQYNIMIVASYGGHMNGGHNGWDTFLTFVNWFHILCVIVPCLYFGAGLSGGGL